MGEDSTVPQMVLMSTRELEKIADNSMHKSLRSKDEVLISGLLREFNTYGIDDTRIGVLVIAMRKGDAHSSSIRWISGKEMEHATIWNFPQVTKKSLKSIAVLTPRSAEVLDRMNFVDGRHRMEAVRRFNNATESVPSVDYANTYFQVELVFDCSENESRLLSLQRSRSVLSNAPCVTDVMNCLPHPGSQFKGLKDLLTDISLPGKLLLPDKESVKRVLAASFAMFPSAKKLMEFHRSLGLFAPTCVLRSRNGFCFFLTGLERFRIFSSRASDGERTFGATCPRFKEKMQLVTIACSIAVCKASTQWKPDTILNRISMGFLDVFPRNLRLSDLDVSTEERLIWKALLSVATTRVFKKEGNEQLEKLDSFLHSVRVTLRTVPGVSELFLFWDISAKALSTFQVPLKYRLEHNRVENKSAPTVASADLKGEKPISDIEFRDGSEPQSKHTNSNGHGRRPLQTTGREMEDDDIVVVQKPKSDSDIELRYGCRPQSERTVSDTCEKEPRQSTEAEGGDILSVLEAAKDSPSDGGDGGNEGHTSARVNVNRSNCLSHEIESENVVNCHEEAAKSKPNSPLQTVSDVSKANRGESGEIGCDVDIGNKVHVQNGEGVVRNISADSNDVDNSNRRATRRTEISTRSTSKNLAREKARRSTSDYISRNSSKEGTAGRKRRSAIESPSPERKQKRRKGPAEPDKVVDVKLRCLEKCFRFALELDEWFNILQVHTRGDEPMFTNVYDSHRGPNVAFLDGHDFWRPKRSSLAALKECSKGGLQFDIVISLRGSLTETVEEQFMLSDVAYNISQVHILSTTEWNIFPDPTLARMIAVVYRRAQLSPMAKRRMASKPACSIWSHGDQDRFLRDVFAEVVEGKCNLYDLTCSTKVFVMKALCDERAITTRVLSFSRAMPYCHSFEYGRCYAYLRQTCLRLCSCGGHDALEPLENKYNEVRQSTRAPEAMRRMFRCSIGKESDVLGSVRLIKHTSLLLRKTKNGTDLKGYTDTQLCTGNHAENGERFEQGTFLPKEEVERLVKSRLPRTVIMYPRGEVMDSETASIECVRYLSPFDLRTIYIAGISKSHLWYFMKNESVGSMFNTANDIHSECIYFEEIYKKGSDFRPLLEEGVKRFLHPKTSFLRIVLDIAKFQQYIMERADDYKCSCCGAVELFTSYGNEYFF